MKHRNSDMIIAKAENTELVVFIKYVNGWAISGFEELICLDRPFFLCLPQHKEACLHWLNGGDIQVREFVTQPFCDVTNWSKEWQSNGSGFMCEDWVIRIKTRKEKRWVVTDGKQVKFLAHDEIYPENWQIIEIEVEV